MTETGSQHVVNNEMIRCYSSENQQQPPAKQCGAQPTKHFSCPPSNCLSWKEGKASLSPTIHTHLQDNKYKAETMLKYVFMLVYIDFFLEHIRQQI